MNESKWIFANKNNFEGIDKYIFEGNWPQLVLGQIEKFWQQAWYIGSVSMLL